MHRKTFLHRASLGVLGFSLAELDGPARLMPEGPRQLSINNQMIANSIQK